MRELDGVRRDPQILHVLAELLIDEHQNVEGFWMFGIDLERLQGDHPRPQERGGRIRRPGKPHHDLRAREPGVRPGEARVGLQGMAMWSMAARSPSAV